MQDDFIAVVIREELLQACTGLTPQGVKPAVWVDINDNRHGGCVSHQGRRAMMVGVNPAAQAPAMRQNAVSYQTPSLSDAQYHSPTVALHAVHEEHWACTIIPKLI